MSFLVYLLLFLFYIWKVQKIDSTIPNQRNSYNKDQRNSYNKDQRNSYNKDQRNSYNKDQRNSYNKDQRNSYNKEVLDGFHFFFLILKKGGFHDFSISL
jgi:hypothetical protein